jgi:hypothetical protein
MLLEMILVIFIVVAPLVVFYKCFARRDLGRATVAFIMYLMAISVANQYGAKWKKQLEEIRHGEGERQRQDYRREWTTPN